jgi:hypothetical protein
MEIVSPVRIREQDRPFAKMRLDANQFSEPEFFDEPQANWRAAFRLTCLSPPPWR